MLCSIELEHFRINLDKLDVLWSDVQKGEIINGQLGIVYIKRTIAVAVRMMMMMMMIMKTKGRKKEY